MSGDRIAVDPELLRQHAAAMRTVAADVQEAVAAAQGIDLGGGAFGVMCAFLVPPAQAVSTAAVAGIASSRGMLDRTVEEVLGFVSDVEAEEGQRVEALTTLQKSLD